MKKIVVYLETISNRIIYIRKNLSRRPSYSNYILGLVDDTNTSNTGVGVANGNTTFWDKEDFNTSNLDVVTGDQEM